MKSTNPAITPAITWSIRCSPTYTLTAKAITNEIVPKYPPNRFNVHNKPVATKDKTPTINAISPNTGSLCPQGWIGFIKSTTPIIIARMPKIAKKTVAMIIEVFLLVAIFYVFSIFHTTIRFAMATIRSMMIERFGKVIHVPYP